MLYVVRCVLGWWIVLYCAVCGAMGTLSWGLLQNKWMHSAGAAILDAHLYMDASGPPITMQIRELYRLDVSHQYIPGLALRLRVNQGWKLNKFAEQAHSEARYHILVTQMLFLVLG